jgi:hypothetical protein
LRRPFARSWREKVGSEPAFFSKGVIHLGDMPKDSSQRSHTNSLLFFPI